MSVDYILDAKVAERFFPGEIGEVDVRLVATPNGPKVFLAAYQCKKLTDGERSMLQGLLDYTAKKLKEANYRRTTNPSEGSAE